MALSVNRPTCCFYKKTKETGAQNLSSVVYFCRKRAQTAISHASNRSPPVAEGLTQVVMHGQNHRRLAASAKNGGRESFPHPTTDAELPKRDICIDIYIQRVLWGKEMKKLLLAALLACVPPFALSQSASTGNVLVVTPSAGDLAAPVNRAIAACPPGGCTIEIAAPASTATLSVPILINKSNVHVKCDSPSSMATSPAFKTTLSPNGYYWGVVDIAEASNVSVEGCNFDVTSVPEGLVTLHVYGGTNVVIDNNRVTSKVSNSKNAGMLGVRVEGNAAHPSTQVKVTRNIVTVPWIAYSVGNYASEVNFANNSSAQSGECFDFNGSGAGNGNPALAWGISFTGSTCSGDSNSSYVESARDVTIANNQFSLDGLAANGPTLRVHVTSTDIHLRVTVDGNHFAGSGSQSNAASFFQNVTGWKFINNTVRGYGQDGLLIDSSFGSIVNGTITGNTFLDNGQTILRGATLPASCPAYGQLFVLTSTNQWYRCDGRENTYAANAVPGYCAVRFHQSAGNEVVNVFVQNNVFGDDQATHTEAYPLCADGGQVPAGITYAKNLSSLPNSTMLQAGCSNCSIHDGRK